MNSTSINRACESCRSAKVRCQPALDGTPNAQQSQCRRCAAVGKACTYTEPRRTKRKRTDVRVRELERELKALGELLRTGRPGDPHGQRGVDPPGAESESPVVQAVYPEPVRSAPEPSSHDGTIGPLYTSPRPPDPVDSGLLSMQHAARLFDRYISDLSPQRPVVVFQPGTRAAQVRADTPALFLAVLVAASETMDMALCTKLNDMLLQTYAERIVVRGERSLELIQAILVSTNWYCQSGHYDHMKFYQQLHMAATLAVDLDLGEPTTLAAEATGMDEATAQRLAIDRQRTLLGCYICCSSISLNYHRPNMFLFSTQMKESIQALETSPFAAPGDAVVAAWARLHHIIDLSDAALALRGDSQSKVNLSDEAVQLSLLNCTKQLESWKKSTPIAIANEPPLLMQYHSMFCLLHQSCLYAEYSPADFRPPYSISIPAENAKPADQMLTPAHLSSVTKCISSACAVLDTFLSIPVTTLACSPVPVYARMGYAVVLLLKIHISAALPGGLLHGIVDPGVTNMERYLEHLIRLLTEVSKQQCRLASLAWFPILSRLQDWYRYHLTPGAKESGEATIADLIQPLRLLQLAVGNNSQGLTMENTTSSNPQDDRITLEEPGNTDPALLPDLTAGHSFSPGNHVPYFSPCLDDPDQDMLSGLAPDDWSGWVDPFIQLGELHEDV